MNKFDYSCDVAVFGAGPAGLAAAITAARKGMKVLLIEKNGYLGGTLSSGIALLGFLDVTGRQCIAGFAQEFVSRLQDEGHSLGHRYCPKHNSVSCVSSEYAKILAAKMCKEAGVDVLLHSETHSVETKDNYITSVKVYGKCNETTVAAKYYIDCTGDGDVAYLAGCDYEKGQADTGVLQPPTVIFTLENVHMEELFEYLDSHPEELTYNKIMDVGPGYDVEYFRSSKNYCFVGLTATCNKLRETGELPVKRENLIFIGSPNTNEVYVNSTRLLNTDATDIWSLTNAELEGQIQAGKLTEMLRKHVAGFENCFISSICPNLGVRETRRFAGQKRLEIDQAFQSLVPEDTIALSGYKIDIHSGDSLKTEFKTIDKPFGIPFGCLVSKNYDNLLFAGRCISTDARVIGSTRVMPTCMAMGQAAGTAVSQCIKENTLPKDAETERIRKTLAEDGAILSME